MVQVLEFGGGEAVGIEQGGGEHLDLAGGQLDPHQAQPDPGLGIDANLVAGQPRVPVPGLERDIPFGLAGLEESLDLRVIAGGQTHDELTRLLLEQGEQPLGGIAPVEQDQTVRWRLVQVQLGAASLAHVQGHQQGMQRLLVEHIVEHRQAGHGELVMLTEEAFQPGLQRQMDGGAVDGQ